MSPMPESPAEKVVCCPWGWPKHHHNAAPIHHQRRLGSWGMGGSHGGYGELSEEILSDHFQGLRYKNV